MMDDRKEIRWNMLLFLPVYDREGDGFLGYIADLAENGILLFSADHIEMGSEYHMVIRHTDLKDAWLAKDIDGDIEFLAQTRWIDFDVKPAFHRTGFMFKDVLPEMRERLQQLIQNVSKCW